MPWAVQASTAGGGRTKLGRKRVCFTLQFDPTKLDAYLEDHKEVWPEMQKALVECGWHNYSLFYRPDGFAVGYFETDDSFATACERMDKRPINNRWQATMSKYTPSGKEPLEEDSAELKEYFYLGENTEENVSAQAPILPSLSSSQRLVVAFTAGIVCGLALARVR